MFGVPLVFGVFVRALRTRDLLRLGHKLEVVSVLLTICYFVLCPVL